MLESKKRVDKIEGYLAKKEWANVQSELTRQVHFYFYSKALAVSLLLLLLVCGRPQRNDGRTSVDPTKPLTPTPKTKNNNKPQKKPTDVRPPPLRRQARGRQAVPRRQGRAQGAEPGHRGPQRRRPPQAGPWVGRGVFLGVGGFGSAEAARPLDETHTMHSHPHPVLTPTTNTHQHEPTTKQVDVAQASYSKAKADFDAFLKSI